MPTLGEEKSVTKSIVDFYLKWKGAKDAGKFTVWNKESSSEDDFELKDFIVLKEGYAIKGHSDKYNKPMYSNQIDNFKEELTVKSDGKDIASGKYSDIKGDIELAGGKLHIILTVLDANGKILQLAFKGKAFANFLAFKEDCDITENKVVFSGYEDGKKGAISFRSPVFTAGDTISKSEMDNAILIAKKLSSAPVEVSEDEIATEDNLPF